MTSETLTYKLCGLLGAELAGGNVSLVPCSSEDCFKFSDGGSIYRAVYELNVSGTDRRDVIRTLDSKAQTAKSFIPSEGILRIDVKNIPAAKEKSCEGLFRASMKLEVLFSGENISQGSTFKIDTSESQDVSYENFIALCNGVISVKADLSPRSGVRRFVEGDRAVLLSPMIVFEIKLMRTDDSAQSFILSAGAEGKRIRYIWGTHWGEAVITGMKEENSDIIGTVVTLTMACA